jgi:general L-amino acid transport system permease protein
LNSAIRSLINPSDDAFFWNHPQKRSFFFQLVFLILVLGTGFYFFSNAQSNLEKLKISSGFGYLQSTASFDIGESLIPYTSRDSYGRALLVGFLNTLKVSIVGIMLALVIGVLVGVARISSNWLLSKLSGIYVEALRNIPLLLQLFFWYALMSGALPMPRQAFSPLPGVYLTKRGLFFPEPELQPIYGYMGVSVLLAFMLIWLLRRWVRKRKEETGKTFPLVTVSCIVFFALPALTWVIGGTPLSLDTPKLQGFNFVGGASISPEYVGLLLGLVLYTSSFMAEIVRAGIQSVPKLQVEAARSIGMKQSLVLRLVVLPQGLRVIIPPMTSQMLNLTKNSSLAIAIGYPDFVAVSSTTINQTGQAIECVTLIMVVYLFFSLVTSFVMNWYNKKIALKEK